MKKYITVGQIEEIVFYVNNLPGSTERTIAEHIHSAIYRENKDPWTCDDCGHSIYNCRC